MFTSSAVEWLLWDQASGLGMFGFLPFQVKNACQVWYWSSGGLKNPHYLVLLPTGRFLPEWLDMIYGTNTGEGSQCVTVTVAPEACWGVPLWSFWDPSPRRVASCQAVKNVVPRNRDFLLHLALDLSAVEVSQSGSGSSVSSSVCIPSWHADSNWVWNACLVDWAQVRNTNRNLAFQKVVV